MIDKYADLPIEHKTEHLRMVKDYVDGLYQKPSLNSLFIEMTLDCNERCRHCGSKCGDVAMENALTDKEILDFLKDLKGKVEKKPFLNITGGEPLLRKGFTNLMHEISELGYYWGMTTNGTLIDEQMVKRLIYAGMKTVSVSIDGLEESHNWFRQTKDGYERAMRAVELLVRESFHNVMITTVVHKKNIHQLHEMYEMVKQTGVDTWRLINVEPIGRAKFNNEILLEAADYVKLLDFIKEYRVKEQDFEICFGCNHWLGVENEHRFRNWYYKCAAGIKTGGIFYNGDIGACLDIDRKPETIQGNIRMDDFWEVWNQKFEVFRYNRALESDYCKNCTEKEYCRGDGFHTWNLEEKRPELCMYKMYCRER